MQQWNPIVMQKNVGHMELLNLNAICFYLEKQREIERERRMMRIGTLTFYFDTHERITLSAAIVAHLEKMR
jgi:hypothetical protein